MRKDYQRRVSDLPATEVEVRFSPSLREAFEDLSAAVHFSDQVEPDTKSILKNWAGRGTDSARGFVASLAAIAEEIFKHIHANDDERAAEAWAKLTNALINEGFTLAKTRPKAK